MNTTTPLQPNPQRPTIAQLFGNDALSKQYAKLLPEVVQFSQPITLRIDFHEVHQLEKYHIGKYKIELLQKYPPIAGRNNPEFTCRLIKSGPSATYRALLEMFQAFLSTVHKGTNRKDHFSIRPSAIASYRNIAKPDTVNDHLWRLEEAGMIQKSEMQFDQSYKITFNPALLGACRDRIFTQDIINNVLKQCPELAQSPEFQSWTKRLNPSFFAVDAPGSAQKLGAYLLFQEHNTNNDQRNFVHMGETSFPTIPPSSQEQGSTETQMPLEAKPGGGANEKIEKRPEYPKEKNNAPGEMEKYVSSRTDCAWNIVKSFVFWKDKKFTYKQAMISRQNIQYWIELYIEQFGLKEDYIAEVFLPVLRNQKKSLQSGKYFWRPPSPEIYFSPEFLTDDGKDAGYAAAVKMWEKNSEFRKKKKNTRKWIKSEREKNNYFIKCLKLFMQMPTVKNLRRAEEKIQLLKDRELQRLFYDSVIQSNLLTRKKLIRETESKINALTAKRIQDIV